MKSRRESVVVCKLFVPIRLRDSDAGLLCNDQERTNVDVPSNNEHSSVDYNEWRRTQENTKIGHDPRPCTAKIGREEVVKLEASTRRHDAASLYSLLTSAQHRCSCLLRPTSHNYRDPTRQPQTKAPSST